MPAIVWDSKLYEQQHRFVSDYGADVLQWLNPRPGEDILDVGCGTGQLAAQIAESGANVFGIDASASMIATAKENYAEIGFEVVDATQLHYQDIFDAIFSNATFHWIENQDALIAGLYRSLKKGGRLVAEFGGKHNVKSITDALQTAANELGLADRANTNFWFFPSISTYATLLEKHGLEVEQAWLFDRPTTLNGENGTHIWISQFAQYAFKLLNEEETTALKNMAVALLKPTYFRNGVWTADYRRLRIKAWKKG
jgi:trans-aconitate methyltransferase